MLKPIADRAVVKALKRIDPGLSVDWCEPQNVWGVFHDLQVPDNVSKTVDLLGRELAKQMRADGYEVSLDECIRRAGERVKDWKLVCYVTEEDGSYRPLDGRIVEKLQRMNFLRQNVGLLEWQALLKAKAEALEAQRERAMEHVVEETKQDKAFAHCVSNILWGTKTPRHFDMGDAA